MSEITVFFEENLGDGDESLYQELWKPFLDRYLNTDRDSCWDTCHAYFPYTFYPDDGWKNAPLPDDALTVRLGGGDDLELVVDISVRKVIEEIIEDSTNMDGVCSFGPRDRTGVEKIANALRDASELLMSALAKSDAAEKTGHG